MRFALYALLSALCISGIAAFTLPIREVSTDQNTVNFFTLGDWGSGDSDQDVVAGNLTLWAQAEDPLFLFSLGDNFYEDGVVSDTDPQWKTKYTNVYSSPAVNFPWYALLGNHDHHEGHGQGEIDYYLNKRDSRWFLPSWWYSASWKATTGDGQQFTMQGIFIDTVMLFGSEDFTPNQTQVQEQIDWLTQQLKSSTADWLFVSGHYPVYSGGEHGNDQEVKDMAKTIRPLFEQYKVDAYFCGHDHTLQVLENNNVHYIVSGNGGKIGDYTAISQSIFGATIPGFGIHSLNSTHLTTQLVIDAPSKKDAVEFTYTQPRNVKPWEMAHSSVA